MALSEKDIQKIKELSNLKEQGVLSEEEFAAEKAKILSNDRSNSSDAINVAVAHGVEMSSLQPVQAAPADANSNLQDTQNPRKVGHCCHFCLCFWLGGLSLPCWVAACCDCCCHQPCGCDC